MRVGFAVASWLQCFSTGGTLGCLDRSKQSPGPFLPSPIRVLFTEHAAVAVRGETCNKASPAGPSVSWSLTSRGWDSRQTVSLVDSTMLWFTSEWGSRIEIFRAGNHTWPQSMFVYFAALLREKGKKTYRSQLLCLKTLQIHAKPHWTESPRPPACTIFIISLNRHGLYSGVLLSHSWPKAPSALSHHLK